MGILGAHLQLLEGLRRWLSMLQRPQTALCADGADAETEIDTADQAQLLPGVSDLSRRFANVVTLQ